MRKKCIIFVCTGNTCRSPMAEIIMKNKLKLAGITDIRVKSAGLRATEGAKMSKFSSIALKKLGYKFSNFKSRQLTGDMINKANMVICMTSSHKEYLSDFKNVYTVAEVSGLLDVLDPFGQDLSAYIKTSHQIEDACNIILEKILEVKGEN